MDSLITAAARALAAGDPLGALNRVALRDDELWTPQFVGDYTVTSTTLSRPLFGGLTYDEAAAALNISPATVHRELTLAKACSKRRKQRSS